MPDDMTMGPVEIAVIAFPGNQFTGEIAPAVADLVALRHGRHHRPAVRGQGR